MISEIGTLRVDCPRKGLLDAVQLTNAVNSGRTPTLPIFQNLLFEARDGNIRLVGCDGEMWVERVLPAMVSDTGGLAINGRLFQDILNQLPDGDVHIEQPNGTSLKLSLATSEYRVVGITPEDFPDLPDVEEKVSVRVKRVDLEEVVSSVDFAVAKEHQGRPVLTGVLLHYDGEKLKAVATDTHRLAIRSETIPGIGGEIQAIVPERTINILRRLPVADDGELNLVFGESRLLVTADGSRVVSQLLSGSYPPYERVVPKSYTRRWMLDKEAFAACLKRVGVLAKESAERVVLRSENDNLVIHARSEGLGEGKEEMQIVKEGDDIEIAFNAKYLLDALHPVKSPGVYLEMTENDRAALLKPSDETTDYCCVIMPMALV